MRKLKYKKFQCDTDSYNYKENMLETQIVNWINKNLDKIDLVSICHYSDSYAYYESDDDDDDDFDDDFDDDELITTIIYYATVYYFDK